MDEELKKAASPYTKLEKTMTDQHADIVKELKQSSKHRKSNNELLKEIRNLKQEQIDTYKAGKKKDFYLSMVFLTLAFTALYLDIIKFNPEGVILTTLFKLIGL